MQLQEESVILKTLKIKEQNEILTFFTKNNGVINGYWKKRKSNISVASIGMVNYYTRLSENLGYVSFETTDNIFAKVFHDDLKCTALNSIVQLLCLVIPPNMPLNEIYIYFHAFLLSIKMGNMNDMPPVKWLDDYIILQMHLLRCLGFGLNLTRCSITNDTEDLYYISPKTGHVVTKKVGDPYKHLIYVLPRLMYDLSVCSRDTNNVDKENYLYSIEDYIASFKILFFFIEKNLLVPYNLKMPFWCKIFIKKLSNDKYNNSYVSAQSE